MSSDGKGSSFDLSCVVDAAWTKPCEGPKLAANHAWVPFCNLPQRARHACRLEDLPQEDQYFRVRQFDLDEFLVPPVFHEERCIVSKDLSVNSLSLITDLDWF
jgi:hypothetical protein